MSAKKSAGKKPESAASGSLNSARPKTQDLTAMQAEIAKEKQDSTFYQLEKDQLLDYVEISKSQLNEAKSEVEGKNRQIEEMELLHRSQIKTYKQKVKHLLYEYQTNLTRVESDAQRQIDKAEDDLSKNLEHSKNMIRSLRVELKESEITNQQVIKALQLQHDQEITALRMDFDRRCRELYSKYSYKTKSLREELDLRRKNELHELEERKNAQINSLMKQHERSFVDMKNYYNDITLNNLALINNLKQQVIDLRQKEERNEKLVNDVSLENKRLKDPLESAQQELEILKKQLKGHEQDRIVLKNLKNALKLSENEKQKISWEKELIEQQISVIRKDKNEIYEKFHEKCKEIEQKVSLKNVVLEKKLHHLKGIVDKRSNTSTDEVVPDIDKKTKLISDLYAEMKNIVDEHNKAVRETEIYLENLNISTESIPLKRLKTPSTWTINF